jgi:hypothetical protein
MHRLWRGAPTEARRLLRVLFLRLGTVSANSGGAFGRDRPGFLLCGVIPHGKRGPKLTRLVAQPAHQPVGVVDPSGRHSHRASSSGACSSRDLDHGAHLDGDSVHSECEALRTHSLPLHWTLLSRHDRPRARARSPWARLRGLLRMACISRSYSCRKQDHLVGRRACMGKILVYSRYKFLCSPPHTSAVGTNAKC